MYRRRCGRSGSSIGRDCLISCSVSRCAGRSSRAADFPKAADLAPPVQEPFRAGKGGAQLFAGTLVPALEQIHHPSQQVACLLLRLARLLHRPVGGAEHGRGVGGSRLGFPGRPLPERHDQRSEPAEHEVVARVAALDRRPYRCCDLADLLDLLEQLVDRCAQPWCNLRQMVADHGPQLAIPAAEVAPVDALETRLLQEAGDQMEAGQQPDRDVRLRGGAGLARRPAPRRPSIATSCATLRISDGDGAGSSSKRSTSRRSCSVKLATSGAAARSKT